MQQQRSNERGNKNKPAITAESYYQVINNKPYKYCDTIQFKFISSLHREYPTSATLNAMLA